jgi:t-SNARE complex subunit (syntaxin)
MGFWAYNQIGMAAKNNRILIVFIIMCIIITYVYKVKIQAKEKKAI